MLLPMPSHVPIEEPWYVAFCALVERNRPENGSDKSACKKLAPVLSLAAKVRPQWTPNYLLSVLHKSPKVGPSPLFILAVEKVVKRKPRIRHDKPRVYVPVDTIAERDLINRTLGAEKKRAVLLAAAVLKETK